MGVERTQVAIIGAGPAGLLLGRLLSRAGIDAVILEARSREYVEARIRAGVLEQGTVDVLHAAGVGDRLDREGLRHGGIYLSFDGARHHMPMDELTGGRAVTVYGQTEVVKDLIAARLAEDLPLRFEAADVRIEDFEDESADRALPPRRRRARAARRRDRRLRRFPRRLPGDRLASRCGSGSGPIRSRGSASWSTPRRPPTS